MRLPLVPVIATVNVPVVVSPLLPVKVRVEVPVPPVATVTLVGLKVAVTPEGGAVDSVTVPANPPCEVIVMVVVAEPPLCIVRLEGDALMLKSPVTGTVTVRL